MTCPICNSSDVKRRFNVQRDDPYQELAPGNKPAEYFECAFCGCMVFHGDSQFEKHYKSGSYYNLTEDLTSSLKMRFDYIINLPSDQSDNLARVRRVFAFIQTSLTSEKASSPKWILDVGSGMGVFLFEFLKYEVFNGVAIEPDKAACEHLAQVLPTTRVERGYSHEIDLKQLFFLITLNRVLEHTSDPTRMLEVERDRLDRDGIIYVEVPDTLSYYLHGADDEAFGYGHFVVYSPLGLCILTKKAGLDLVALNRVVEPSGKFTLYAFLKKSHS